MYSEKTLMIRDVEKLNNLGQKVGNFALWYLSIYQRSLCVHPLVVKTYLACNNKHLLVLYICVLLYTENLIKTRLFKSWYMYYIESQFSRLNQYPLVFPPQSLFFFKLLYISILKQTYLYIIWMFIDNYFLDTTLYPFLDLCYYIPASGCHN